MALNPNKDLKLYYSIGEVAQEFGVNESLLRFWESEFPSIAPKKNGRGVRMYTKENIEEIRLIYNLVKVRGMKLSVAQKTLATKRGAVQDTTQVLEQLQQVRNELVELRKLLNGL
jgi:DNA-binding transcriptional MerR regulator